MSETNGVQHATAQQPAQSGRIALQRFVGALNRPPDEKEVKQNPSGALYIPISFLQMSLDEYFFGLWKTENFRWQVMGNEIAGSIDLHVFHPVERVWIVRTGAAATMIRQHKGAAVTDYSAKIHNALEMDVPHLLADCLRNAVQSLGKLFGRDLNRKFADAYAPLIKAEAEGNGATTVEMENRRQLDSWAMTCETLLSQCRLEEMQHRTFDGRIRGAESVQEFQQIKYELEMLLPEAEDPRKQFQSRLNR